MAIRRILVAVNDLKGKTLPAVLKAAQLARACNAKLELFHAVATPLYTDLYDLEDRGLESLEQTLRQQAHRQLESIADNLRQHSIRVGVSAAWDFPVYEAIVRRARQIKADLIVASRHTGRHTLPWLLGLTDWELVRVSPIPVLLVKNPHAYRHPAVLAAIDPAHAFEKPLKLDKAILRMGETIRAAMRGSLHAVHAYARVPFEFVTQEGVSPAGLLDVERRAARIAALRFERALRATRVTRARRYLVARPPIDAIVDAARQTKSSIVVMGAVSRSGFKRLLIGNTAERILDKLSCDVLVVKPAAFRTPVSAAARGARVAMSTRPGSLGFY